MCVFCVCVCVCVCVYICFLISFFVHYALCLCLCLFFSFLYIYYIWCFSNTTFRGCFHFLFQHLRSQYKRSLTKFDHRLKLVLSRTLFLSSLFSLLSIQGMVKIIFPQLCQDFFQEFLVESLKISWVSSRVS